MRKHLAILLCVSMASEKITVQLIEKNSGIVYNADNIWKEEGAMIPVYWLIALVVFLVIEIVTLGLTTIWFAGGALVAFLAAMLDFPLVVQVVLFFCVTFILLLFTRPVVQKHLNNNRLKTNVNSMIGKEGKVTEAVDNFNGTGKVIIAGMEWTARSINEDTVIPVDAKITVREVQGVKVLVELL